MSYIHRCGIIHCDLKPENILISCSKYDTFKVKLADFGLAKMIGPNDCVTNPCGTIAYIAPEVAAL